MQFGDFVATLAIVIAQLTLDRLHLLVQVIFALGLFHLAFDTTTDLLFDLQHAELAFHEGKGHFKAAERIGLDQQRLLVRNLQVNICRNCIGQRCRRFDFAQLYCRFRWHFLVELRIILELFGYRTHQSGRLWPFRCLFIH